MKRLCLKIDVDTHDGMKHGVPALLEDLAKAKTKATFCLSFGPDNAGKAIFRALRDISFLKKMIFTGAPSLYGLRTILSGTLLPARPIASAFPELCRQIKAEGHEVIVHAWDHRRWQDHLQRMEPEEIRDHFSKAFKAFETIFGHRPRAVAAPGWQVTPTSLAIQDGLDLLYASDLRDAKPCFLTAQGQTFCTLQIPTTGPCIEELLSVGIREQALLEKALLEGLEHQVAPVLALHAEVEGGVFRGFFQKFLPRLLGRFEEIVTLCELAQDLLRNPGQIPCCQLGYINLPGRSGKVATGLCHKYG